MVELRFYEANKRILKDLMGMKEGESLLITANTSTPFDVIEAVIGHAESLGFKTQTLIATAGRRESSKAITNFAKEFDGICNMGGGGYDSKEVAEAGTKSMIVGGGPGIDESLVRCIADVDVFKLRDEAWKITEAFDKGKHLHITCKHGSDFHLDLNGALGYPTHGFIEPGGVPYDFLPPATPGVDAQPALKDRAYGKIVFDAYLGGVGLLREPVTLYFEKGQFVKAEDGLQAAQFWERVKDWPEKYHAEIEIGTNPNAMLVAPNGRVLQEWERVRGEVHIGLGDWMPYAVYRDGKLINPGWKPARHHTDGMMWAPTVTIDDKVIVKDGIIQKPYSFF